MKAQPLGVNNYSNQYHNSIAKGVPLNSHLFEVKHLKMDLKEHHIDIQLQVDGLCGKNYKLEVAGENLVLTALRFTPKSHSKNASNYSDFRWITSTFFLPYDVEGRNIVSELKDGILHIKIPTLNKV